MGRIFAFLPLFLGLCLPARGEQAIRTPGLQFGVTYQALGNSTFGLGKRGYGGGVGTHTSITFGDSAVKLNVYGDYQFFPTLEPGATAPFDHLLSILLAPVVHLGPLYFGPGLGLGYWIYKGGIPQPDYAHRPVAWGAGVLGLTLGPYFYLEARAQMDLARPVPYHRLLWFLNVGFNFGPQK